MPVSSVVAKATPAVKEGAFAEEDGEADGEEDGEEDEEEVEVPGLQGHGGGRLPSTLGGERAVSVSAGNLHSLAITADGSVWSWGDGGSDRLGHGDQQDQLLPKKVEAFAGQHVVAVSAGPYHSLAITADGDVFAWGAGESGCLGHGEDLSNQLLPKKIEMWAPGQ